MAARSRSLKPGIFAVGQASILHFQNGSWHSDSNKVDLSKDSLFGVRGKPGGTIVAVGGDGNGKALIVRSADNGNSWFRVPLVDPGPLHAVWQEGQGPFFSVGVSGTGTYSANVFQWTSAPTGVNTHLLALTGGAGKLRAAGQIGLVLPSLDGIKWGPADVTDTKNDLWGAFTGPNGAAYFVGGALTVRFRAAVSDIWEKRDVPNLTGMFTFYAAWGSSDSEVYLACSSGVVFHTTNAGNSWVKEATLPISNAHGIWGTGPSDVYVVGSGGSIFHGQ